MNYVVLKILIVMIVLCIFFDFYFRALLKLAPLNNPKVNLFASILYLLAIFVILASIICSVTILKEGGLSDFKLLSVTPLLLSSILSFVFSRKKIMKFNEMNKK